MELLAIGLDILDPGLDGLEAGKLVNDQAIGVGRLAEVDPELLAVAQGDALAAVALHRPHDLGYDLAVVGLRVVDGGVNDRIDGHARCLLLGVCDALDHDLSELGDLLGVDFSPFQISLSDCKMCCATSLDILGRQIIRCLLAQPNGPLKPIERTTVRPNRFPLLLRSV